MLANCAGVLEQRPFVHMRAADHQAMLSLTASLSQELKDSGVSITALCPGITATQANQQLGKLPDFLNGDVNEVARQTS